MLRITGKDELYQAIDRLLGRFEVIGPRDLTGKGIFYQPIARAADLYLGASFTIEPVKKYFLSPSEYIFKAGQEVGEEIALVEKQRLIIGVRPCEARGLTLLDKVFDSEYKDKFYMNNRRNTVIVGLSCLKPDGDCFCVSMGGSPVENRGMDAIIFDTGKDFIIETVSEKGKDILGALGSEFSEAEKKSWSEEKEKRRLGLKRKVNVPETLGPIFESDYWRKVSFPCLSCGICTYLCPTCHCFDLVDEERKKLRCYDGCAFADFTLEASGVNPRPTKKERYRQRVFHKFEYFKKNFGEDLCVGCGRCIRHCPVKIDIADIVDKAPLSK
jgi:sulfhydrogenase subunit beta (sulfur reductase)